LPAECTSSSKHREPRIPVPADTTCKFTRRVVTLQKFRPSRVWGFLLQRAHKNWLRLHINLVTAKFNSIWRICSVDLGYLGRQGLPTPHCVIIQYRNPCRMFPKDLMLKFCRHQRLGLAGGHPDYGNGPTPL
jgi:hypothetical protein